MLRGFRIVNTERATDGSVTVEMEFSSVHECTKRGDECQRAR
jgi:hypothetical protein